MRSSFILILLCGISAVCVVIGFFIGRAVHWPSSKPTATPNATASPSTGGGGWTNAFRPDVQRFVHYVTQGQGMGSGWNWLANVSDTYGNRMLGSKRLEDAIAYLVKDLKRNGFDNVHTEDVPNLPLWVRGEENATLLSPRVYNMGLLGVGGTVATPPQGITADVIVVRSFDELTALGKSRVTGKIVVFNEPWISYGASVAYRAGANQASQMGAVAVLIRSVTSFSVYSPHTGIFHYHDGVKKIPAACITVEDAQMLWRMQQRGQKLRVFLKILSQPMGTTTSKNTIFEITGSTKPQEIVLLSGHFDSWDVGEGAMDDGAGCAVMWQALMAIKKLGLRPKRTIRVVLWTAEEPGLLGASYYHESHKNWTNETFIFVTESDEGAFKPSSSKSQLMFRGPDIGNLVHSFSIPLTVTRTKYDLGDVEYWARDGIPGFYYINMDTYDRYFTFHHTNGDMMTVLKPSDLDYVSAVFGTFGMVVANMNETLPRFNHTNPAGIMRERF